MTDELKRRYVALRTAWLDAETAQANDSIDALSRSIDQLAQKLRGAAREHANMRRRLGVLAEVADSDGHESERDLEALMSLPGVASVDIAGDRVMITTRTVDVAHDGRSIELGRYRIEISPASGVVIERSRGDGRRGWDHPHIQGGRPCLGNLQVGVETLVGRMELAAATALLLQFLESYDAETAYCPIEMWEQPITIGAEAPG